MKKKHFSFMKRVLSAALCLAMLLAFLPAQEAKAAQTESKTYTVIAGSDFQYSNSDHGIAGGNVRNILATIKNQGYESFEGLLFCGDYSQAFTTAASQEGVAYLKNVINEELPGLSDDQKFFLQGNHDMDVETTDGTLTPSGAHETEGYSVYAINEKDYMWYNDNEAAIKTTAANLRSYLNAKCRAGYTKPIFIMSHMQLHYSMRTADSGDGQYANYLFDVINEAAGNGLNIIFLFGHNHSNGWDDYLGGAACYLNKGDSILIGQKSNTQFKEFTLNFTYMNAGYVGYYTRVNSGADNTLTMSVFEITDDQVTIRRYSANGIHNLKSQGVTNSYKNETAYGADERVLPSPQVVQLNKDIKTTAVAGASVVGQGITSFEVLAGASQRPQGYATYLNYQINAQGYVDGEIATVTLPVDSNFNTNRPVLVLDHQYGKTIPVMADGGSVTFTVEHMGSFTLAQSDAAAVSAEGPISSYFDTVEQGESPREGVPYVITDSKVTGTSHWALTGTAVTKNVGSISNTGLALEEIADANTSPVWYYDNGNLRFGSMDGQYLNISYTGTYNGDSTAALVTLGEYDAATTAKVTVFGTGPSYNMGVGTAEEPLYLAHRNSGTDSIAATYAKYNYNTSLWYLNEVISSAKLTVIPSQDVITLKNTIVMAPTVSVGADVATDYTLTWTSGNSAVATVSADGIVTPVKPGQTVITAILTTLNGNEVSGISVELPITVVGYSKTDSTVSAQTQLLHQQGEQEEPVAGQTYLISFYSGGWYLTGTILHKGDEGYNGRKDKEGMMVAQTPTIPNDIWYYDGEHLYSGTEYNADKCLVYENEMVTLGPVTENNQAFIVDKSTYSYWPYISVDAGRLNHYGGNPYNVAGLYNGNNFMCFHKVIPDQKVAMNVTPAKSVLYAGESVSLTAEALLNDSVTDEYTILWTSSDLCVAKVDSKGVVTAVDGGEAIITASLVSINGNPLSEALSVEVPIQIVKEQQTATGASAQLMLDRSLQRVTSLESGKAYMISSTLSNNWVWSDRFAVSPKGSAYSGIVMEHFDLNGGLTPWYYLEQEVDGVVYQYLRYGNLEDENNYLVCNNRDAQLGTADGILFDTVEWKADKGSFQIYYSPTTRYLNQLGGKNYDVVIPTSNYTSDAASHWYFNTILPGGALELKLDNLESAHVGQPKALSYALTLDGAEISDYQLVWTSANRDIATVNNGQITGVASGSTQITASVTEVNGKTLETPLTVTVSVSVEGHHYETVTQDPDCVNGGYTTYICAICGDSYMGDETAALGHHYEAIVTNPDCLNAGYTTYICACGDQYVGDYTDALGHSYNAVVTAPTCTESGYTTYTCGNCGFSYIADRVSALDHNFETVILEATCTADGSITDTCTTCGAVQVQIISATGHSYNAVVIEPTCTEAGYTTYTCVCGDSYVADEVVALGHKYNAVITVAPGCESAGTKTFTCQNCGDVYAEPLAATGHNYETAITAPTCTQEGYTTYSCPCGHSYIANQVAALGHSFVNGICGICGEADPDYVKPVVIPTLALKAPTLEFKDMITVNAMFEASNIEDVVEMGMITYTEKVDSWSVETAAHVIPGTTYDASTGRYIACSQGIHAKYLGDAVYLACYAKLTDGSYVYTKLASYSPVQYATSKLKGTDVPLKQLVVAMLNYGAAAQVHFGHNVENLANATLTAEQIALPEAYRADMVSTVASPDADKQGAFANNKGFSKRYPSISFEGAFCINYFFTPAYVPVGQITLYYWNAADYEAAEVLTVENASGSLAMELQDNGEYRADIAGIAAKALSEGVYVAATYTDGVSIWTSGVLGYSIGAYCSSQATKGGTIADLAMATAVYGYQAKQYFG